MEAQALVWRPIETLDTAQANRWRGLRTVVLACFHQHMDDDDEPTGEVSCSWAHVAYRSSDKWMLNSAGFAGLHGNASFPLGRNATHWMLLPPPPPAAGQALSGNTQDGAS